MTSLHRFLRAAFWLAPVSRREQVRRLRIIERQIVPDFIMCFTFSWPNNAPEPTAVGAVSSAIAVHVVSRRWLSFLR
jgi:hypothetical protein